MSRNTITYLSSLLLCAACATTPVDTHYVEVAPVRISLGGALEPSGWVEAPLYEATAFRVRIGDAKFMELTGASAPSAKLDEQTLQKLFDFSMRQVEAKGYCKKAAIPSLGRRIVRTLGAHESWIYVDCDPPLRPYFN